MPPHICKRHASQYIHMNIIRTGVRHAQAFTHAQAHTYTCTTPYTYTPYVHMHKPICTMYTCYVHMYASTCSHQAHVQAHVRMHKPIRTHVRTHKPIRAYTYICMHAQAYTTYTCTCTHLYVHMYALTSLYVSTIKKEHETQYHALYVHTYQRILCQELELGLGACTDSLATHILLQVVHDLHSQSTTYM